MAIRLRDLVPESRFLEYQEHKFPLYPLNLSDISILLSKYQKQIEVILKVTEKLEDFDFELVKSTAPDLLADIIAFGLRVSEKEDIDAIKTFPPGVQLTALLDIWDLSVPNPKALAAHLVKIKGRTVQPPVQSLEINQEKKSA